MSQPQVSGNMLIEVSTVPEKDPHYIPFGFHDDIRRIIESRSFIPAFVSGLSGCGKTLTIMQVCSLLGREAYRVNITCETDEDDLIGGFRLLNGETKFAYGPVVAAMKRGAVLILDEVDLASYKIMCLQPVLEGRPLLLKKTGEYVQPSPGFTVVATANTKGQGNETGKFVGTGILNEAFLERFAVTFEQDYPPVSVEESILKSVMEDKYDFNVAKTLVAWANNIRVSYKNGSVNDVISTRRLVDIAKIYRVFDGDIDRAIELCTSRFSAETHGAFRQVWKGFWKDVDPTVVKKVKVEANKKDPFKKTP